MSRYVTSYSLLFTVDTNYRMHNFARDYKFLIAPILRRFIVPIQNCTIWNVRWRVPSDKWFSQNDSSRRRWIHVWISRKTLREDRTAICVHYELQAKTEESPSQGTRTWRICLNHNNSINYLREPYLRHNNRLCGLPARICDCIAIRLSHVLSPRDNVKRPMTFILLVFITVIRRKRSSGSLNDIEISNDRFEYVDREIFQEIKRGKYKLPVNPYLESSFIIPDIEFFQCLNVDSKHVSIYYHKKINLLFSR